MPLPLYLREKTPQYPLDRRLRVPQSRSGRYSEEKNLCACRQFNPDDPARSPSFYRLSYRGFYNNNNSSDNDSDDNNSNINKNELFQGVVFHEKSTGTEVGHDKSCV
jgi:hypothetical protein